MTYRNCRSRTSGSSRWQSNALLPSAVRPYLLKSLWRDPFLLSTFLIAGLLTAFQLDVALSQPSWRVWATDWLRATLAWLELLVLVLISLWLSRTRRHESAAWWMFSAGVLVYAIAQTLWGIGEVTSPDQVAFPGWPDLFYLLQYPCFFLALTLLPRSLPWGQSAVTRVKVILDCLLVMAAATTLSWYFLLAPIYERSSQSLPGKATSLAYPVGDLGVLFGLVLVLAYRRPVERGVLLLLIGAIAYLALGDSLCSITDLHAARYVSGGFPDLFWMACYLLFPLAGLVQFRRAQREVTAQRNQKLHTPPSEPTPVGAIAGSLRFLLPFVAALLAGWIIVVQATVHSGAPTSPLIPLAVVFGLLILVIARQELTFLEGERWRREREAARTNELLALQEANQRMDTFLGMASHELRTPLANIKLGLQLHVRRAWRLAQRTGDLVAEFETILEGFARVEHQELRLERLVNDLLDVSRIQAGKLELHSEWTDLVRITRAAVEEQRQAAPNRAILLQCPTDLRVPTYADAGRIEQVVTNYLTNALKYSPEDRPVEVGLSVDTWQARVWVRDEGPGLPPEEQERIWERFHRASGIEVQSGTGVGLGLGLHICRTIIEWHEGHVGVESRPGVGSTFWFTLPQ
jgi:signal transduction histidine kinase